MHSQRDDESFDPDAWEGDPEQLIGYDELLSRDDNVCDRTFSSKRDAFNSGSSSRSSRSSCPSTNLVTGRGPSSIGTHAFRPSL